MDLTGKQEKEESRWQGFVGLGEVWPLSASGFGSEAHSSPRQPAIAGTYVSNL
jgi:hypothetical protein